MDDPRITQARPGWALAILSAPIVAAVVVVLLYVGMWSMGMAGRAAAGDALTLEVRGCPEGVAAVGARLADMGLPAELAASPVAASPGGGWITTRTTGRPEVDTRLLAVLATPGRFELRGSGEVLAESDDVAEATSRLDGMMDVWLLVRLEEAAAERVKQHVRAQPKGRLHFALDGVEVAMQPNTRDVTVGEVEGIPLADMDRAERFHRVAEWAVLADHPLPCPVEIQEVQRVPPPPG